MSASKDAKTARGTSSASTPITYPSERRETGDSAIRPFSASIPEEELVELRRRISATRWPERETVVDDSQGVPLALLQELARYWATDYDWRWVEARLNSLPNFVTNTDGVDVARARAEFVFSSS
jgi:epoxide hydrolase-like protein